MKIQKRNLLAPWTWVPLVVSQLVVALVSSSQPVFSQAAGKPDPTADEHLSMLKNPVPEVRIEALRALQTSLDPRIPDAVLPLLADVGESTRRLAARAVGSRWWQIPKGRTPGFIDALVALQETEDEGNQGILNMAERALGLLRRDYRGKMFVRSMDKRWVVYERRGLPCLIDTGDYTEELLGWTPENEKDPARPRLWEGPFNMPIEHAVLWHPRSEMVAFDMCHAGRPSPMGVWVWQHGSGMKKMRYNDLLKELRISYRGRIYNSRLRHWKGGELQLEFEPGNRGRHVIGWDVPKRSIRLISGPPQDSPD